MNHLARLLLFLSVLAGPAAAADLLTEPSAWQRLKLPLTPATSFRFVDQEAMLRVSADRSVAFLYRPLEEVPSDPVLSWSWRVEKTMTPTDQTAKGKDDRPIALHLWFADDRQGKRLFGRLGRLFGHPDVGRVITYVFGGLQQAGTIHENPYYADGRLIILRDGETPEKVWFRESRNIAADYRAAFPAQAEFDPGDLRFVAISGDTDDTETESVAHIANLSLASGAGHDIKAGSGTEGVQNDAAE